MLKTLGQPPKEISVDIERERDDNGGWKTIHISYHIKGQIRKGNAWKACQLSIEKYCPLAETVIRTCATISWELKLTPAN